MALPHQKTTSPKRPKVKAGGGSCPGQESIARASVAGESSLPSRAKGPAAVLDPEALTPPAATTAGFRGAYAFCSNLHLSPVKFEGYEYRCVEAAFQAAKFESHAFRVSFEDLDGVQAKRLGRTRHPSFREDWDDLRLGVMATLLESKFEDPTLRAELLRSAGVNLVEKNTWGDTFWGVCRGVGENHLGRLLMNLRDRLAQQATGVPEIEATTQASTVTASAPLANSTPGPLKIRPTSPEELADVIAYWTSRPRGFGYHKQEVLAAQLRVFTPEQVKGAMWIATASPRSNYFVYMCGILRNWRKELAEGREPKFFEIPPRPPSA